MLGHYDDHFATRLSNRPILLMEEERHRLARELHDDLLQKLTALGLRLDLCMKLSRKSDSATLEEELAQLKGCWEESLSSMRHLVEADHLRFRQGAGVRGAVLRFADKCREQNGVRVSLDLRCLPESRLHIEQGAALVHIVGEALRNAHQHACATCVTIWAEDSGESLQVFIEDDGVGFDVHSVTADYPRRGLGLAWMRERARGAGGELLIESEPGRGTILTLVLPLWSIREPYGYGLDKIQG
jgi:hypothetical protein